MGGSINNVAMMTEASDTSLKDFERLGFDTPELAPDDPELRRVAYKGSVDDVE